jgi:hypothetical protein
MAIASVGAAFSGCTERPQAAVNSPATNSLAYEPSGPVVRSPLSPLAGQTSPPPLGNSQPPFPPYGNSYGGADPQTAELQGWRASPRWSAIEGNGCIEVEQDGEARREAEGEAPRMKVETCAKEAPGAPAPAETIAPPDY